MKNLSEKIGNITLNMDFYGGNEAYSDGEQEEKLLLDICKKGGESELLRQSRDWEVLYHLSDIRHNVIEWFHISKDETVLEIGSGCGGVTGILAKKAGHVTCVELSRRRSQINAYRHQKQENIDIIVGNFEDIEPSLEKYDVITLIGVWEYASMYISGIDENPYLEILRLIKKHLTKNGRVFIAIENKTGMKYWNGAVEDHTGKLYSGLNDYSENEQVRTFSKCEIKDLFAAAGIGNPNFYYPVPDYKLPDQIYSDYVLPIEGEIRIFHTNYDSLRLYNFMEDAMYDQVCHDEMFPYFSNSYVITTGNSSQVGFAKYNRQRREEYRIATKIIEDNKGKRTVVKSALSESAVRHILAMPDRREKCCGVFPNIVVVDGWLEGNNFVSEYVDGETLEHLFYPFRTQSGKFVEIVKKYIAEYLTPAEDKLHSFVITHDFEEVFGDRYPLESYSLEITNVDAIFSNLKRLSDDVVVMFDFEWVFGFPIPYRYVLWRASYLLYDRYAVYLRNQISKKQYLEELGFKSQEIEIFDEMEWHFSSFVCGWNDEERYEVHYRKEAIMQAFRRY